MQLRTKRRKVLLEVLLKKKYDFEKGGKREKEWSCYRPMCTISMEISAGETPEIREACPRVTGLIMASF